MVEHRKADEKKTDDKPAAKSTPAPKLARAGESGDAGVHNLLAQRVGYAANGLDEQVADVDRQLAELGYTAE